MSFTSITLQFDNNLLEKRFGNLENVLLSRITQSNWKMTFNDFLNFIIETVFNRYQCC